MEEKFIFVHIPNAGGTSLIKLLKGIITRRKLLLKLV